MFFLLFLPLLSISPPSSPSSSSPPSSSPSSHPSPLLHTPFHPNIPHLIPPPISVPPSSSLPHFRPACTPGDGRNTSAAVPSCSIDMQPARATALPATRPPFGLMDPDSRLRAPDYHSFSHLITASGGRRAAGAGVGGGRGGRMMLGGGQIVTEEGGGRRLMLGKGGGVLGENRRN